jgi:hypothetical protein
MKKRTKKMRIKKINELFDDSDLKSRFEIPYLKGDLGKEVLSKWHNININKDGFNDLLKLINFEYPVLARFNQKMLFLDGNKILSLFATSLEPVGEIDYYAQISLSEFEGSFYINVIFRELENLDNSTWNVRSFKIDDIKEADYIIKTFLNTCEKLNIIRSGDKVKNIINN